MPKGQGPGKGQGQMMKTQKHSAKDMPTRKADMKQGQMSRQGSGKNR